MAEREFTPRWFTVKFPVYPPIPMVQTSALTLATNLASKLSLTDIHMSDEVWEYRRPHATEGQPRGLQRVEVRENEITIEHRFPATGLESFERLIGQVYGAFVKPFAPQVVFGMNIELDYVVDLETDARQSLLEGLRLLGGDEDRAKIDCFGRPCHLIGLRLGFPPFRVEPDSEEFADDEPEKKTESDEDNEGEAAENAETESTGLTNPSLPEGADWQATVTMVTLDDDPTKISVEVSATWPKPCKWSDVETIVEKRLAIAEEFLRKEIKGFLEHFKGTTDGDENES